MHTEVPTQHKAPDDLQVELNQAMSSAISKYTAEQCLSASRPVLFLVARALHSAMHPMLESSN